MSMRRLMVVALAAVLVVLGLPRAAHAKDKLVMGVHPFKPAVELHKAFGPIAEYVSKKIGKPVELQIAQSYEDAAKKVRDGVYDFSYLGPNTYAKYGPVYKLKGLAQIVNAGKPTFYGVVVVKKGSPIKSLKELKGKTFAFGDRNSTLTHVVPLYMLVNDGIHVSDLKKAAFLPGSHDNLALAVATGAFDATGMMPDIAAKYPDLEVIAKTPFLPEHVFAATPSMDPALFGEIQAALLGLDPQLQKGIKGSLTGMQKVNDKDFDGLRKILETVEKEPE